MGLLQADQEEIAYFTNSDALWFDLLIHAIYKSIKAKIKGISMAQKTTDPTNALVAVVKALEPLTDDDKKWVLSSAASRWTLNVQVSGGAGGSGTGGEGGALLGGSNDGDAQAAITKEDPRAFMRAKRPTTDVQRVACIGYYLVQTTGKHGFSSKDVSTAYTLSGGSKINIPRAIDNATRGAKYLSSRGHREKQLTVLGEDVVVALPNQEAVKEIEAASKGRSRTRGKKKSSKKAKRKA